MKDTRRRFLTILVVCSVALNILFIGAVAGRAARHLTRHDPGDMVAALKPERQKVVMDGMDEIRAEYRQSRMRLSGARDEVFEILTAPEFDADAYRAKVAELGELRRQMRQRSSEGIAELASTLDREERKALAGVLRSRGGRGSREQAQAPGHQERRRK